MIGKEFFLAGKAIFTIEMPDGNHYTYSVCFKAGDGKWQDTFFVNLLVGPDNYRNYKCFGILNHRTGGIRLTRKTNLTDESYPVKLVRRVFANIWAGTPERIKAHNFHVHHTGKCGRCGRLLTVPASIEMGLGPTCASKSMI